MQISASDGYSDALRAAEVERNSEQFYGSFQRHLITKVLAPRELLQPHHLRSIEPKDRRRIFFCRIGRLLARLHRTPRFAVGEIRQILAPIKNATRSYDCAHITCRNNRTA